MKKTVLGRLSYKAMEKIKWILTLISGLLTTSLVLFMASR